MYNLAYKDFWPACMHAEEGFSNAIFERFDILLPKVNSWLRQFPRAEITKCQTLEKRITGPEQLSLNNPRCEAPPEHSNVYFIKGLRVWYYIMSPGHKGRQHPMQLGYRNFLPRCLDQPPGEWPEFEDLTELYTNINNELDNRPVEGCVLTVETVALRVMPQELSDLALLAVDQCQWLDGPSTSLLYITRVYYCFQCPAYEQVGAADFFPDHQTVAPEPSLSFSSFSTIAAKINCWLSKVKDIRITNIQTLETVYEPCDQEDKLETSTNFLPPEPEAPLVRFVRVTYVRPKYGLPPGGLRAPRAIWFQNFVPFGIPELEKGLKGQRNIVDEDMTVWERVQHWQEQGNRTVLDIECLYYPVSVLKKEGEHIETTVLTDMSAETIIEILRVYYSCSGSVSAPQSIRAVEPKPNCILA